MGRDCSPLSRKGTRGEGERVRLVIDYEWVGQVFTALLMTGGVVTIAYQVREFHRRGLERVRRAEQENIICPWCLDNSRSCGACDDGYEGE